MTSLYCSQKLVDEESSAALSALKQATLRKPLLIEGVGVFTGEKSSIRICPAAADFGIVFQRVDLPTSPFIPATVDYVQETPRCTVLGDKGVSIHTVEHLLAALRALDIDNALIEISGSEVPMLDGSAKPFVEMIEKAGLCAQEAPKKSNTLSAPVFFSQGDVHIIALPSPEYRISYTLHYPSSPLIAAQYCSVVVNRENFKAQIAPARTFSLYEEIAPLLKKGLLKGGSLENSVIIKGLEILNPGGLRFPDEMVRHKILDVIGDLSLIPRFVAHIIAIRSGHASNNAFAKEMMRQLPLTRCFNGDER